MPKLPDCCPPMGISIDMVKGRASFDKTGKSIPFGYSGLASAHGLPSRLPRISAIRTVLGGLRIRRTELYDLSFLRFWHRDLFILKSLRNIKLNYLGHNILLILVRARCEPIEKLESRQCRCSCSYTHSAYFVLFTSLLCGSRATLCWQSSLPL